MKRIAVVSAVVGGAALLVSFSIAGQEITINKKSGGAQKSVTIQRGVSDTGADQSLTVDSSTSQGLPTTVSIESLEENQGQQAVSITTSGSLEPQKSAVVETSGGEGNNVVTVDQARGLLDVQKSVSIGSVPGGISVEKSVSGAGVQKTVTIGQGAIVVDKNVSPVTGATVAAADAAQAAGAAADAAGRAADAAGRAADAAGVAADEAGAAADRIGDILDGKR